jgi:hypothetical protein
LNGSILSLEVAKARSKNRSAVSAKEQENEPGRSREFLWIIRNKKERDR